MSSTVTAHVARLLGPCQLVFEKQPLEPGSLKSGEIFAETICSAISVGTELAAYLGEPPLRPGPVYPRLMGYCNVAEVRAIGPDVKHHHVGDRILTFQSHRSAFICPESKIILRLPPDADVTLAVTTYLFHLGYNALLKGGFMPGQHVAVVGLGVLGFGTVAQAAAFGGRVTAFSNQESARSLAKELGASAAFIKSDSTVPAQHHKHTGGIGADLVVTTSNRWEDWQLALQLARKEGVIAVLGFPGRGQAEPDFNPLDSRYFYDKQLRLVACGMSPDVEIPAHELRFTVQRNCEFLLERILARALPAQHLIAGTHSWRELSSVYETLARREGNGLTRILQWRT
jgi:threonine dehydrogenase-like Zn-dependent dehydrogenase